ncbi:hypothetical protein BHE74_00019970 [Ensete ventricosum]|nr:hypothetical protein GW17_00051295 [Ensete ventricosum]RWW72230.1 hypothetical protein BHE74_00019970 [Ensete ventricosum]
MHLYCCFVHSYFWTLWYLVWLPILHPLCSAPPRAKRKGGPGGLNKVCGVSPELQPIVGEAAMSRTQIVKQLWVYIRKNNLQDPNNKRKIICNDELRRVFETDSTDMFKMNKLLSKHIIPLDYPSMLIISCI